MGAGRVVLKNSDGAHQGGKRKLLQLKSADCDPERWDWLFLLHWLFFLSVIAWWDG
jgi:hypothetical protein